MTKTLTEQWRKGKLPEGYYYIKGAFDDYIYISHLDYEIEEDKRLPVEEVLAPVPDYGSLYNPNDGRIPVGLFTVLKLIKRDIEQYQKIRHLTDLECGIKSQVVSLLKKWNV